MTSPVRQAADQAANVVAGVTISTTVLGITVQDWAAILAAIWILLQMGWWLYSKVIKKKE